MAFRFKNFKVYQDSKQLHKEIVTVTNEFPRGYWYLADQVKRSSLSIVLSVAEGSSKQSDKDFNRYIAIALGSVDETVACLGVALDMELITEKQFASFERRFAEISNQLGGFSKFLKRKSY